MRRTMTVEAAERMAGAEGGLAPVDAAVRALAAGEAIVVHDEEMCVLAAAAHAVDAAMVARFCRDARGVIAVAMTGERLDALGLGPQSLDARGREDHAVLVDAIDGTTTGISAPDRAATVAALLAGERGRLGVPGHIVPVRAAAGGTFARLRAAEACVDLAGLAGLPPVVAYCAILDEDGEVLRAHALPGVPQLADRSAVSTNDVRRHRRRLLPPANATPDRFREAMSLLVAGVAAVTVSGPGGRPAGMLATSVTSFTDKPPSILVSVAHGSRTHDPLLAAPLLGVHLLADHQAAAAAILASKADDKFANIDWSWDGAVPRIRDTVAYLRCERSASFVHHDHTVVVADVEAADVVPERPLVYFQRSFTWGLSRTDEPAA